ncbi:T9SS type A sorting domain-containing protein [Fluviicola sp.]|uniref:T9SS type A sorting domain-containing protein n=1 Tax=Fluviicola sp. TaxID=1917219 RepID=UPI002602530D|nr:T9SS type A sorting domain-containing protein [Fluviicola sp.]
MKRILFNAKSAAAAAMIFSIGLVSAQNAWMLNGNLITSSVNYAGTTNFAPFYLRTNGAAPNPGQALLNEFGSFLVESVNNTNTANVKGSLVFGTTNRLGINSNSSLVGGWGNDVTNSGGANIVVGQGNIVGNGASKSVALGWVNDLGNSNQFAIGAGIRLVSEYSGGFGIDLEAHDDRSFVFGSGTHASAKLVNNIPRSIMFGMSDVSTVLIKDQYVGIRTTAPTANFHSVGTVRLEGLPSGTGNILVVDASGNLMVSASSAIRTNENPTEFQAQIDGLKKEIQELKDLISQQNKLITGIESEGPKLYQNTPNPAKGETVIRYYLPNDSAGEASIEIYNTLGQFVKSIRLQEKGNGSVNFTGLGKGSYIYHLTIGGKSVDSRKMLIED